MLVAAASAAALPEAAAGAGSGCRRRRRAATERPDPNCRPAKRARRVVLKSKSRVRAPQAPRHTLILRVAPALAQVGEGAAAANEEGSDDDEITAFATASARDLEVRSRRALTLRFVRQFVRIGKDLLCAPTITRTRRESVASPSALAFPPWRAATTMTRETTRLASGPSEGRLPSGWRVLETTRKTGPSAGKTDRVRKQREKEQRKLAKENEKRLAKESREQARVCARATGARGRARPARVCDRRVRA